MLCDQCIAQYRCKRKHTDGICDAYIILSSALKMAQVPARYATATLNTYDVSNQTASRIVKFIRYIRTYPATNLIITGNVGTGKTYAACVILNEYIIDHCLRQFDFEHPLGMFANYSSLMTRIKNSYGRPDDMLPIYLEHIYNVPLLVLDNVGATVLTEYVRDLSFNIFDTRYANQLSTIITTNLSVSELTLHLGERIVSRLLEGSSAIVFDGKDGRKPL